MSWNPQDNAKLRRAQRHMSAPSAEETSSDSTRLTQNAPPWQRAQAPVRSQVEAPEQIPTMAHEGWWLGDTTNDGEYTMDDLRELNMQGMMSERQWQRWAHLCTRGIPSL